MDDDSPRPQSASSVPSGGVCCLPQVLAHPISRQIGIPPALVASCTFHHRRSSHKTSCAPISLFLLPLIHKVRSLDSIDFTDYINLRVLPPSSYNITASLHKSFTSPTSSPPSPSTTITQHLLRHPPPTNKPSTTMAPQKGLRNPPSDSSRDSFDSGRVRVSRDESPSTQGSNRSTKKPVVLHQEKDATSKDPPRDKFMDGKKIR